MNFKNITLNQSNSEAFVSYGKVLTCKDGIIEIAGLRDVITSKIFKWNAEHTSSMFLSLKNSVSAIVLGNDTDIVQGDLVTSTGSLQIIPAGGESVITKFPDIFSYIFTCVVNVGESRKSPVAAPAAAPDRVPSPGPESVAGGK